MNAPLNFHELAKRDPAMAVLMGAISGFNFGYSEPSEMARPQFSAPPATQFGDDYGYAGQFGAPDYGYGYGLDDSEMGNDYGFGRAARRPAPAARKVQAHHPHPHHPHAHPHADPTSTSARTMLLDPNRNSTVKVERYSFSFSPAANLVLGTASAITTFTQQPSASIKPQRVVTNAPQAGFVFMSTLQIANVNVFIGGTEDAFTYSPLAQNTVLDLPRLDPQNRATSAGNYSGVLPPGFAGGAAFTYIITLQGPATLAGGFGQ